MKTGKSPDRKTMNSKNCVQKTGSVGVRKSSRRTNKSIHETHGCGVNVLVENEVQCLPFKEAGGMGIEISSKDPFLMEKRKALELHPEEKNISSAKMKLQLFPINKGTQIGLEKGGHNPYLELTLGGQKKISSVLKHLKKKWGSSIVAIGEPMLFPYNIKENLSNSRRWTLDDSEITAAAVHAAVGSPAIFRLRYGWFSINDPRSMAELSVSFSLEAGVRSEGTEGGGVTNSKTLNDDHNEADAEYKATDMGEAANSVGAHKVDTGSGLSLDNEPISSVPEQPSLLWVDGLSNISIGGLLSEASLQGNLSALDSKQNGSNAGMQPGQIISDSLDAFIISQNSHPKASSEDFRPSILDAEETCHAFSLRKFSSPGTHVQSSTGKTCSGPSSLDISNSFKLPEAEKVNDNQDGPPQDFASGRNQTDLLLSRTYDEERSLGLGGINWCDSLGPFDLGMPAQKLTGGDSVSIGGFVR
ncbi:TSL-kinase interacting protein 1 [Neltuma alba]|uniref:TSL-kinase interacting protein 1 n=1 Tax=Neltuma alba TaxID=207710 RepID=UPI0010A4FA46|nr:TSL-kinase interacting protein 1 [Prosopis alba]XP_028765984.1 TSL-kinase interacting protein 1 [Prosopis alba]XP_028765985.1 TSL-kinase interacting protein 1 [Prosopis alba]